MTSAHLACRRLLGAHAGCAAGLKASASHGTCRPSRARRRASGAAAARLSAALGQVMMKPLVEQWRMKAVWWF
jgi:hypothetical protein